MSIPVNPIPTSCDIWLELDGKKVAVVQSYHCKSTREASTVEAFGEREPVATMEGAQKHTVELTRLYATDSAIADGISFYDLKDFSLVICKPDRRVIYTGCRWSAIEESARLRENVAEKLTLVARRRLETGA